MVPRGYLRFVIVVFPDHTHLLFLVTERDRLLQCGIVRGKGNSSGHHCMSGVCGIEHYVMTW